MGEMKVGHTPGLLCVGRKVPRFVYAGTDGNGDAVAECDGSVDGLPRARDEANAARIVACWNACADLADPSCVPDLLAALELARRWMCEVAVAKRGGNFTVALDRVDAAIAKAEGR